MTPHNACITSASVIINLLQLTIMSEFKTDIAIYATDLHLCDLDFGVVNLTGKGNTD